MEIKKEILDKLKKQDVLLKKIVDRNARGFSIPSVEKNEFKKIYMELTGIKICSSCSKDWLIRLGKWYLENIDKSNESIDKPTENIDKPVKKTQPYNKKKLKG